MVVLTLVFRCGVCVSSWVVCDKGALNKKAKTFPKKGKTWVQKGSGDVSSTRFHCPKGLSSAQNIWVVTDYKTSNVEMSRWLQFDSGHVEQA